MLGVGRVRKRALAVVFALTAVGLPSKWYAGAYSDVIVGQVEDLFGTMVMFFLVRILWVDLAARTIAVAIFAVVLSIELSQLVHGELIDALRATWLGRVTLGTVFDLGDVLAYAAAVALALAIDVQIRRAPISPSPS
jgi:hypothetical protein